LPSPRCGVRIRATLVSPRIAAGPVFRAAAGTIDHTSVLKTIQERWNVAPLTRRDKAAASLADVLTLAVPRTDDPLKGVIPPVSKNTHPLQSTPSLLERVHAEKVAALPLRNDKGIHSEHTA